MKTPETTQGPENLSESLSTLDHNDNLRNDLDQADLSLSGAQDNFLDKHGRASGLLGDRNLDAADGGTNKVNGKAVEKHAYFKGKNGNTLEEGSGATKLALAEDMQEAKKNDDALAGKADEIIDDLNTQTAESRIAEIPEVKTAQSEYDSEVDFAEREKAGEMQANQVAANDFMSSLDIQPTEEQVSVASGLEEPKNMFTANESVSGVFEDNNTQTIAA